MDAPEYDARDVLDKYVATLSKPEPGSIIRDVAELAHPKDIIRFVLQHCIKTIDEAEKQDFLRDAYLALGNFQELSEEERKAVLLLGELGPPSPPGTDEQEQQAKRIEEVAVPLQTVLDRLKAEVAVLSQELKCLPGPD
jgi:hypothetical protein